MTDAQIGKKFGLSTQTVRSMRMDQDIPFETIKTLCHALECQPGDIMEAMTAYYFPATKKGPNT